MPPAAQKMITCILPKGVAATIAQRLKEEYGLMSANINNARGAGRITPLAYRGVGEQSEKEILTVTVPAEQGDELFEYIYHEAGIDRPHGGIMYMHGLQQATIYTLPEVPDEV
jgi:hypothetical protein